MSRLMLIAAASVLFAAPAFAQLVADSDQPLQVTSTKDMVSSRTEGTVIYQENVRAVQGGSQLASDKLTVYCPKPEGAGPVDSCDPVQRIVAEGNVIYTTPRESIRGDRAEYDYPSDTITVTGKVIMSRGDDGIVRGSKVVYQVGPGLVTVTTEGGGQVMGIFNTQRRSSSTQNRPAQNPPAQNPPPPPSQN